MILPYLVRVHGRIRRAKLPANFDKFVYCLFNFFSISTAFELLASSFSDFS